MNPCSLGPLFLACVFAADVRPPDRHGVEKRRDLIVRVYEQGRPVSVMLGCDRSTDPQAPLRSFVKLPPPTDDKGQEIPRTIGRGAGVIIHSQGYLLTNAHVVRGAHGVEVTLADGSSAPADVLAMDESRDVALLRLDLGRPLPAATLGLPGDVLVGESVVAIGNPDGLAFSGAAGRVAGLNRISLVDGGVRITGLIQLDLAGNPGCSGGPIFNALGEVVGLNQSVKLGWNSFTFAVSTSELRRWLPSALQAEARVGAAAGWSLEDRRDDASDARVVSVRPDGPAAAAGVQSGDVIERVGARVIDTVADVELAWLDVERGKPVEVEVVRPNARLVLKLVVPGPAAEPAPRVLARAGLQVAPLDAAALQAWGWRGRRAMALAAADGAFFPEGPKPEVGDLLARVAGESPGDLAHLDALLASRKAGDKLTVTLLRRVEGKPVRLDATLVLK